MINPFKRNKSQAQGAVSNAAKSAGKILSDHMPKYNDLFVEDTLRPGNIKNAIDDWRQRGKLQNLNAVMDLLLDSDDNLQSKLSVRVASIKKANWTYKTELPEKQIEFYDVLITRMMTNWSEIFIEGKLKGFQFQQINYSLTDGLYLPTELKTYQNVDLRKVNGKLGVFERDRAMDLPQYKFVSILYHRPVLQSLLKYYLFYSYALNYWSQFAETYGKPLRLGKYDAAADAKEVEVLRRAVKSLGTDQAAIVSKSTEIEFVEFAGKAQTQNLYSALCQFMIDRITTRILGQTMTTQHTTTGAFAMAEVQENVQSDIEEGDLVDFGVFISTIASYVDAINFGGKGVEIEFVPFRAIDLGKRIEIDSKAQQMGLPISQEYVQRTYNIPAPAKGETILERVAPTMPTFNNRDQGRRNAGTESYATDRGIGIRDQGSGIRDGAWVNAETKGIAKFLSMMRDKIRNCGSVEDLKAIDQGEIIAAIAGDLAGKLAKSYTQGRKQKRANSEMPELVFEFDERSIQAINAFRNQAYIISKVRIGEAFQALWDQAARVVQEGGSFTDFIQAADIAGFSPDNPYHLKTEYDTALAATSMAGRWAEIEDLADIYPYLRYVTVGDDHVREEHAVLDGYIAGINDPFWDENYPPNGYNCRCDVEQVTAGEAKDDPGFGRVAPKAALGGDFKVNTGKTDMLPSDAIGKLGENREETAGGRSHGKPSINNEMGGSRSYTKDKNNYPVLVGDDEYVNLDVLTKPDSIIHTALFITEYALSEGDWTEIIKTYKGRVIGTSKISSQEYSAPEGVVEWATVKK